MIDRMPQVTYAAAGSSIVFGLSANELGAMIGAGVAVLSFFVNIWFKHQHLKLARAQAQFKAEADKNSEDGKGVSE